MVTRRENKGQTGRLTHNMSGSVTTELGDVGSHLGCWVDSAVAQAKARRQSGHREAQRRESGKAHPVGSQLPATPRTSR